MSWLAISQAWMPVSITSIRRMYRCGFCEEVTFAGTWLEATAQEDAVAHAPATIICTGTYWRNAWKYQARTYRHFGWDNGTLLANMLAVSAASGLPAEIVLGFVDADVNRLLDLDTRREVSLCLVPIGRTSESSLPAPERLRRSAWRRSHFRGARSNIQRCFRCTTRHRLNLKRKSASGVRKQPTLRSSASAGEEVRLQPPPEEEQSKDTIEQVILRRGSTRTFDKTASITTAQLSSILDRATRGLLADFLEPRGTQLNDLYLIVHSVQGSSPAPTSSGVRGTLWNF